MKKSELMDLVGKKIKVVYNDGKEDFGVLQYADDFSSKHGYRKPDNFYFKDNPYSNVSFKVSHLKKIEILEDLEEDKDINL